MCRKFRMGVRRFDVIPVGTSWWLTDSGTLGLTFSTSHAALTEAKRLADLRAYPTTVSVWTDGVPVEVYRTNKPSSDTRDVGG